MIVRLRLSLHSLRQRDSLQEIMICCCIKEILPVVAMTLSLESAQQQAYDLRKIR
jgi:hypothetical protein